MTFCPVSCDCSLIMKFVLIGVRKQSKIAVETPICLSGYMVLCPFSTFALIDCSCQWLPARQTSRNWVQKTNDWHSGSVWCVPVLSLFDSNAGHCCGLTSLCLSCISWHIGIRWLRMSGDHYECSKSRTPFGAKKTRTACHTAAAAAAWSLLLWSLYSDGTVEHDSKRAAS